MDKYADICFPCSNEPGCLVILFWGEAVLRICALFSFDTHSNSIPFFIWNTKHTV